MGMPALADDSDATQNDTCDGTLTGCDGFYYTDADGTSWTATGLRKVADDLSVNGTASQYYEQFHRNLDNAVTPRDENGNVNDSKGYIRIPLTGGRLDIPFRLVGINHDVKSDGTGKAGLTFMTLWGINGYSSAGQWNVEKTTAGGWAASDFRFDHNNGVVWTRLPEQFRANVMPVVRQSMGEYQSNDMEDIPVIDRISLPAMGELMEKHAAAGVFQYEFFTGKTQGYQNNDGLLRHTDTRDFDPPYYFRSGNYRGTDFPPSLTINAAGGGVLFSF